MVEYSQNQQKEDAINQDKTIPENPMLLCQTSLKYLSYSPAVLPASVLEICFFWGTAVGEKHLLNLLNFGRLKSQ